MNATISNVALALFADIRKDTEKKQEKGVIALAIGDMGIDAKAWKKMPSTARDALLVGYRAKWEESQKGKKCPYCGEYHNGENIPCDSCSPKLIEIVKSYGEYEKSLKGDYAVQNAQFLRKDLDTLYEKRDELGYTSREVNITKMAHILVRDLFASDESTIKAFYERAKAAVVSANEKSSEEGFTSYLQESNK